MRKYGLIGYPLSHSFSPGYFSQKFRQENIQDARYDLYPIENIEKVVDLIDQGITGFNITIPYKEQIIPFLHQISPEAAAIKAVNTVLVMDGKMHGYNTDVIGFKESLLTVITKAFSSKALVLGSGGAAKAVSYVLDQLGIQHQILSRRSEFNYESITAEIMAEHKLIINTTPLGMFPYENTAPDLLYHVLTSKHILFDLIYNPEKTLFLKYGERCGSTIKNGLEMLHLQAEASWKIWQEST